MLIVLNTRNAETGHLVDKIFLLQIIIFPTLDFNCSGPGGIDGRARQRRCKCNCVHFYEEAGPLCSHSLWSLVPMFTQLVECTPIWEWRVVIALLLCSLAVAACNAMFLYFSINLIKDTKHLSVRTRRAR